MDWLLHNPIADMRGQDFIGYYSAFSGAALALAWLTLLTRFWTGTTAGRSASAIPAELDSYELAWLREGEAEVVRLATLRLIHRNYLQFVNGRIEMATPGPNPRHLSGVEDVVFSFFAVPRNPSEISADSDLQAQVARHCQPYEERALQEEWIISAGRRAFWRRLVTSLLILLVVLAAYKLGVAFTKGRSNVGFLMVFLVINTLLFTFIGHSAAVLRLSRRGLEYLKKVKAALTQLQSRASTITPNSADTTLALLAGAFGLGALQDSIYGAYVTALKPPQPALTGTNASSGSCGSSCSSSSSSSCGGGGGCGGGGCGGCGG